jgi:hypothetical protein
MKKARRRVAPSEATTSMIMRAGFGALTLAAAGALGACASGWPTPDDADAARADTTVERLTLARQRYVDKCSGCHLLPLPGSITATKWPGVVDWMAEPAKLQPEDRELIVLYVTAFAAEPD